MPTSFGFTGQRSDSVTGLDYYGARYFDLVAGQFTSADTVLPGDGLDILGLSRYAYVEGNPENPTDPSGHCFCDVPGSGDNFFPQSGGRLLNGETGEVFSGPSYTQVYHLATYFGYHRHHYQPLRARSSPRGSAPGPAPTPAPRPAPAPRAPDVTHQSAGQGFVSGMGSLWNSLVPPPA
jgi:RHS repeat-associated protein